ncbi:MAG TPA: VOC family protein [Longimicrobium sp.]|nr:VOC family protein [Longimicrobium sp.]
MGAVAGGLGIIDVGQVAVNVKDVARATAFYRDVLGLPFLFEIPQAAFFQCGPLRLMLGKAEEPRFDHPAGILYYRVPDIHAAHDALRAAGAPIEREPHLLAKMETYDLWMLFFRDSEDNVAALMSEVARS